MILDTVQSMMFIVLGVVAVAILLRILVIVHKQTRRFKELENRMKAMEHIDAEDVETTIVDKEHNQEETKG